MLRWIRHRWFLRTAASFAAVLLTLLVYSLPFGQNIEENFHDLWFSLRGTIPPPEDVVIVTMDEESYINLGLQMTETWPRTLHARLLETLQKEGARNVVFDIIFQDGTKNNAIDSRLAKAMQQLPVTLGAEFNVVEDPTLSFTSTVLYEPNEIFRAGTSWGFVNIPNTTGVLRRIDLAIQNTPSLPVAAWLQLKPVTTLTEIAEGGVPYINYYGDARTIRTLSYSQALDPEHLPKDFFRGKTVFVGLCMRSATGPAAKDSFVTPTRRGAALTYGVEIHATVFANLKSGTLLYRFSFLAEMALLAFLAFASALLLWSVRPVAAFIAVVLISFLWMLAADAMFIFYHRLLIGGVWILITLPLTLLVSSLYSYFTSNKDRRRLRKAFELYLSTDLADQLSASPDALNLGGREIVGTAFFTDLENFSSISEKMTAIETGKMLVTYFTEVTDIILEQKGTVIKFIGDAVYALWNAPLPNPDHARLAVETAVQVQAAGEILNTKKLFPALITRIGIHTGPMVVGNLGSTRRFDYTGIGDTVNLASRLEGLNKYFGTRILISGATRQLLPPHIPCRFLGKVRVVGKQEAAPVFTVLTPQEVEFWDRSKFATHWDEVIPAFQEQRWDEVIELTKLLEVDAPRFKKLAALYRDLASSAKSSPPDASWTGDLIFDSK